MAWYRTGTVTVNNNSSNVTGAGTLWVDTGTLNPGDILYAPDGKDYEVLSIQSNTGLTLVTPYLGANASAQSYAIAPIGLLPSALAVQVKSTLAIASAAAAAAILSTPAQGLTSTQQANARANIGAISAATPIDGVSVGATTPAAGTFTSLTATAGLTSTVGTTNLGVTNTGALAVSGVFSTSGAGSFTIGNSGISGIGSQMATNGGYLIITGSTNGLALNNLANNATNLMVTDAGAVTVGRGLLTASAGFTSTAGTTNLGVTNVGSLYSAGNIGIGSAASNDYILKTGVNSTGTGTLAIQAGAGSLGYGGSIKLYSHSHATNPGWVIAGISSGSGGKFSVRNAAIGSGADVFSVDTLGNTIAAGVLTAASLATTQTPAASTTASDHSIPIVLNGVTYYIRLSSAA